MLKRIIIKDAQSKREITRCVSLQSWIRQQGCKYKVVNNNGSIYYVQLREHKS